MPAAETQLEAGKVMQFARNIEHVGQQKQNRLVPHVMADLAFAEKGDRFTDETFGLSSPVEALSDWGPTPTGRVDQFRRAAFGKMYHDGKIVGPRENAEKLISPKAPVVEAMGFGRERRRDEVIIQRGLFAATQTETTQDGDITTTAFPTANIVANNENTYYRGRADGASAPTAATVLTPTKIRRAKKLLADGKDERYGKMPIILYEEEDLQNLLTSAELTQVDLTMVKRLENGEINTWLGCQFVKVDPGLLPKVSGQSTQWYTALFLPNYIIYKDRPLVDTRITERADLSYAWHAYYRAQDFVLRRRDSAVIWINISR